MTKWYEATVVATKLIAAEFEDDATDEEMEEFISQEVFSFVDDVDIKKCFVVSDKEAILSLKRHADEVFKL